MTLRNMPIPRKLIFMIILISVSMMVLMRVAFFAYEYLAFREATFRQLSVLGRLIASNSPAALAFGNQADAGQTLSRLLRQTKRVSDRFYDPAGKLFAQY